MIRQDVSNQVEKALQALQKEEGQFALEQITLEHPEHAEHGDYSTNAALVLAKQLNKNPRELAERICDHLQTTNYKLQATLIERAEVAGPGFVNLFLSQEALLKEVHSIYKEKEKYGRGTEKGTVVVDYSGPNIAKPFGIGHLRSTIIGQALYNLHAFLGYRVIGDNHLGDWGTQFGKLLYQIRKEGKEAGELSVEQLEQLYVRFHQEADEKAEEGAREWFKRLEDGDKEARSIWEKVRETSVAEFNRVYELLGVEIDHTLGESFYEPMLKEVVAEAQKRGVAKESRGALVVEFSGDALPPAMLLKSDEATNYFTRDLATVKYRLKKWKPDRIVYEVGAEQTLHLKQVFWTSELLGWANRDRFVHVAHGLYRAKGGKFSTRKGQTVHLKELLFESVERAKKIIKQSETGRDLSAKEIEDVAEAVGIGGVKYNDLVHEPRQDIVFDWDRVLNLKGNSAPYLQYTVARCRSILRKAEEDGPLLGSVREQLPNRTKEESPEEEALLRTLYRFPEVVREAAARYAPNALCTFAFELAQLYNAFYNKHSVLQADTQEHKRLRLLLTAATARVLENSLRLLGIKAPERM